MAAKKITPRVSREAGAELLIESTIELARHTPIRNIGVRDIAAKAGLQTMHIKRYFGSRNELFVAVSNRLMERIIAPLAESPLDKVFPHLQNNPYVSIRLRIVNYLLDEGVPARSFKNDKALYLNIAERIATVNNVGVKTARTYAFVIQLVLQGNNLMGEVNGISSQQRKDIFLMLATLRNQLDEVEQTLGW